MNERWGVGAGGGGIDKGSLASLGGPLPQGIERSVALRWAALCSFPATRLLAVIHYLSQWNLWVSCRP